MVRRIEMIVLGVLVVVLAVVYFFNHSSVSGLAGVLASDVTFTPLNVQEPQLRLDLLDKIQKSVYGGTQRNVFVFGPALPPPNIITPAEKAREERARVVGPVRQPVPPLDVPAQYFGSASMPNSGKRVAFFQSGEDVLVVPEGDTFLSRFRVIHVGNESVDVMENSSGRHASVPMVPPAEQSANQASPNQPSPPAQEVEQ